MSKKNERQLELESFEKAVKQATKVREANRKLREQYARLIGSERIEPDQW